ncbi:MAG: sulfatase family protein [Verrucomicrobiia bacterium]
MVKNVIRSILIPILIAFISTSGICSSSRPNILIAIADDWSYGHSGAYGCRWIKTPAFDRVAQEGLLFTHSYTPNAKCSPSRASLLTGRNPWQLKSAANHWPYFPPEFKTWAEALAENGYYVGMTGKGWAPGVATNYYGKPRQMIGKVFNKRTLSPPTSGISRNDYYGNFEEFLKTVPSGSPWCFWYGATEPHRPYEYGSGVSKGNKKISDIDYVPKYFPDNEIVRNDLLDYAYEVEYFDRHLEKMLALLQQTGQLDNTIVIVTSDNGMPFPRVKGQAYDFANRMPLAIMWKNGIKNPGRVINDYVSFIDFAPTILEVAQIRWSKTGMAELTGESLVKIFKSDKSGRVIKSRDYVLIGRERNDVGRPHDWGYPVRGIIIEDILYLHNFEPTRYPGGNPETGYLDCDSSPTKTEVIKSRKIPGQEIYWNLSFGKRSQEELYNLKNDPDCITNLVGSIELKNVKEKMKRRLFSELKREKDPRVLGNGEIFDLYPYANPAVTNFYERFMKGEIMKASWFNKSDIETDVRD